MPQKRICIEKSTRPPGRRGEQRTRNVEAAAHPGARYPNRGYPPAGRAALLEQVEDCGQGAGATRPARALRVNDYRPGGDRVNGNSRAREFLI
ncbi:MAG: hypothetical protein IH939_20585 [Acidobacteria bacterium]|nr:hypothetical protein [Acidobacteriota bacterium]